MKIKKTIQIKKQRGMIALFVTIVMLLLIGMVTILTSRAVITEQHVSANLVREKSAFESADAGLQFAKNYLRQNGPVSGDTTLTPIGGLDTGINIASLVLDQGTLGFGHVTIASTGTSDDGLALRTIYEDRFVAPVTGGNVPFPLISHTTVDITSNGIITNLETNATIRSGENVEHSGTGETHISNGAGGWQVVTDSTTKGVDIIDSDVSLSSLTDDEYFQNFFNGTKEFIHAAAIELDPVDKSDLYNAEFNNNQLVWVTGDVDLQSNPAIGCTNDGYNPANSDCLSATNPAGEIAPVILVVDGNLTTNGTVDIYGLVYIIGDWDVQGTFNVYGSVIVEGSVSGAGTFNITYDSDVLGNSNFDFIGTKVPNSWRDFCLTGESGCL